MRLDYVFDRAFGEDPRSVSLRTPKTITRLQVKVIRRCCGAFDEARQAVERANGEEVFSAVIGVMQAIAESRAVAFGRPKPSSARNGSNWTP
jgi:hypothetical protein